VAGSAWGPTPASSRRAATRLTTRTGPNITGSGAWTWRNAPVSRLATTTAAEKAAWARVITGRRQARSVAPATALMATSVAPDAAPKASSARLRLRGPRAIRASTIPARARLTTPAAGTRRPHRSLARPVRSMAGRAPAPTNSSAVPS